MVIHFDTHAKAIEHLTANGWVELSNGRWVSRDKSCSASIHPVLGTDVVAVGFNEIANA